MYTWWTFQVKRLFSRVHGGYYSWKTFFTQQLFTLEWKVTGVEQMPCEIILQHIIRIFISHLITSASGPVQNYRSNIFRSVSIKFWGYWLYFESFCGMGHSFELWNNQCLTLNDTCLQLMWLLFGYPFVRPNLITVNLTHNPLIAAHNIKCIVALLLQGEKNDSWIRDAILMFTMYTIQSNPDKIQRLQFLWFTFQFFILSILGKQENKSTHRQRCAIYVYIKLLAAIFHQAFSYLLGHRETSKINI